jgi:glycosyltransferase involved in cell wall biosynthesis
MSILSADIKPDPHRYIAKETNMRYHLALGSQLNLENINREAQQGKRPRHVMWTLSQELGATIHTPGNDSILFVDRLRSHLISKPEQWALARSLAETLDGDDVIYCTGEDIGIPILALCGAKPNRPKIVVFFHTVNRLRVRASLKLFRAWERIDLFVSNTQPQIDLILRYLQVPKNRVYKLPEQIDTRFFSPGPVSADKQRPIIASVGLEKRNYKILADATADLDVDVKISGFSRDVKPLVKSFPKTMPANMSRRFYEWNELVQLYRDADIVVVSLFESIDSAGVTALIEAMACCRPVICTLTKGLKDYLQTPGTVTVVEPEDLNGLRQAIIHLLDNPNEAQAQAKRGYELVSQHHNSEDFVENLAKLLQSVK